MFLAPNDFPVAAHLRETENKWQRQQDFRNQIKTDYVVEKFVSPNELATQVVTALTNWERSRPKLSINLSPGHYTVIVKSPNACESYKTWVYGEFRGELRPNAGERHILWAMFIPTDNPIPIILDFRKGKLPSEVKFYRGSWATYKPRLCDSWVTAKIDEPRFEEVLSSEMALVLEPEGINHFLDSSHPKSSYVILGQGLYTIWMEGEGHLEIAGEVTGTVHEGKPLTFHLDQTCVILVSVFGNVDRVQLENGDYATSYIETNTAPSCRAADGVTSIEYGRELIENLRNSH